MVGTFLTAMYPLNGCDPALLLSSTAPLLMVAYGFVDQIAYQLYRTSLLQVCCAYTQRLFHGGSDHAAIGRGIRSG